MRSRGPSKTTSKGSAPEKCFSANRSACMLGEVSGSSSAKRMLVSTWVAFQETNPVRNRAPSPMGLA